MIESLIVGSIWAVAWNVGCAVIGEERELVVLAGSLSGCVALGLLL